MRLVLQTADMAGNPKNCIYPDTVVVTDAEGLQQAVKHDHVCAEYRSNYRSIDNFIRSDVVVMDCDNDHSEDPDEWMTPEKLEHLLGDYSYAVAFSRHHMKDKPGKGVRPRFHVYFEINEITDPDLYAGLKRGIRKRFPFFDGQAMDAARFIFGADTGMVIWHEGWTTVDEETEPVMEEPGDGPDGRDSCRMGGVIPQGYRNSTLSHFAGKALKRFGETEKAGQVFMEEAAKCDPPLGEDELKGIWSSAVRFFRNWIRGREDYVDPDEYNEDFRNGCYKPGDYSDMGQAKALVREYGDVLRYSDATDYLRYDGSAWIEDRQLAVGAVEEFLDLQLADAGECVAAAVDGLKNAGVPEDAVKAGGKTLDKALPEGCTGLKLALQAAKTYLSFVMKRRDWKYVVSALNVAKPMLAVDVKALDRDENLLNTPEATYDLRMGMDGAKPHDPGDYITKLAGCSPGDAGKEIWEDALRLFFCGDRELTDYVQEIVGMAAVGKVYQEHLIIAYGGGANGKSTFWNTVARVLGTYSGKISAETLTMNCRRNVKPEMAELKGKRLIIASEMEEGMRLNTSVVKQLCSTDEILAEKKFKAPFTYVPGHTIVLYTNHLPKVGANDDGIWRRLVVIPFRAKITGDGDIKNYSDYLYENAGPYILKWIIEGAQKAIGMKFRTPLPKAVEDAISEYREENDWLGQFLDECCELGPDLEEKSGEFYQQYRAYCIQAGEYVRSTADFYTAVEKAGFSRHRTNRGMFVHGLRLKDGQDFL